MEPLPLVESTLSNFLSAPCLIVSGHAVQRRQVLKYVANKLGGVHYDDRRVSKDRELDRVLTQLDETRKYIKLLDLDPVHLEVLSMGQDLLRAPEVAAMLPVGTPLPPRLGE